ncbi:toxin biosynthesis cytochrome p450 [Ilyonectria robusta]
MQQLTIILRTQFCSASEMTLLALQAQDYLNAVLQESLRLYPPAPGNLFRRTAAEGHIVMGEAVPPNTSLTMNLWAANCSALNFHRPDDMVPERWFKSRPAEFEDDDRDVVKPFSMRPHDCPGKKYVYSSRPENSVVFNNTSDAKQQQPRLGRDASRTRANAVAL